MVALFLFLITFTAVAGSLAIGGAILVSRQRQLAPAPQPALLGSGERTPMTLRVRDVVSFMGQSFVIEGRVTFEEMGRTWFAYRMVDDPDERWLRAISRDRDRVFLLRQDQDLTFSQPPGEQLTVGEVHYRMVQRGEARVSHQGRTWRESVQRTDYFEYEGPGDHVLFVERVDEGYQGQRGRRIEEGQLDLLPGDLVKH